jgi:hypothetical protein
MCPQAARFVACLRNCGSAERPCERYEALGKMTRRLPKVRGIPRIQNLMSKGFPGRGGWRPISPVGELKRTKSMSR